jgi:hypothetical protein
MKTESSDNFNRGMTGNSFAAGRESSSLSSMARGGGLPEFNDQHRYSYVRLDAKRAAVETLSQHTAYGTDATKEVGSEGYGTSHGTNGEEVLVSPT